jgi:hypothetical protein
MASSPKAKATADAKVEAPAAPAYVTQYTIKELADAAKAAFQTDKVIVLAALRSAGKEAYTMAEATKIVTAFKNKEVK